MVATTAAGCGSGGGSSDPADSAEGGENSITVLVESGSPAEALANETAADFEAETGCKVVVDAVAYAGMYDKLSTEIKSGEAAHDVACMDFVWLAAFADAIEPLTDADTSDFLPTLKRVVRLMVICSDIRCGTNCKILIYRKDIIPEDKVPTTWEEYKASQKNMLRMICMVLQYSVADQMLYVPILILPARQVLKVCVRCRR